MDDEEAMPPTFRSRERVLEDLRVGTITEIEAERELRFLDTLESESDES